MLEEVTSRVKLCVDAGKRPRILVLTGSGISAESGIKTFRGTDSLSQTDWDGQQVGKVASITAMDTDPAMVNRFFAVRREDMYRSEPNAAHEALADLEEILDDHMFVVTQNVDSLHELAGSDRVCHMHGDLDSVRCRMCATVFQWPAEFVPDLTCDRCGGGIRPNVVLFGEVPMHLEAVSHLLTKCDIFVAIGTSGLVYPASEFSEVAAAHGALTVHINMIKTPGHFDCSLLGPATITVPAFVDVVRAAL